MLSQARTLPRPGFDDFRPGPFETLDRPALVSHAVCGTVGAILLIIIWLTPVRPIDRMTIDQLPKRVSRLLLNESELAHLPRPERAKAPEAARPPGEVARPSRTAPPDGAELSPGDPGPPQGLPHARQGEIGTLRELRLRLPLWGAEI